MPVKLYWSPKAREDLIDIYVFVGLENPTAAESLFTAIETKVKSLSRYPRLGPRHKEIFASTRILTHGPYLLLYETHPDTDEGSIISVEIVRIVDGRRNLSALF